MAPLPVAAGNAPRASEMTVERAALPAKLSPPRLRQALPRERLFDWLDAQRDHAGLWLAAQPGAGKTMLAAGWLESRGLPFLWYRLDADDNDIGHFFGMLGEAARALAPALKPPAFAAEHLGAWPSFARRWFRRTFAALPRPAVLVFDNVEQAALPALPQLLAIALDEAPADIMLLMTSRHEPPPELAGAVLADTLAVLAPAQLRFQPDEARAYARALGLDAAAQAALAGAALQLDGWAAGLRLLSHSGIAADPGAASAPLLFDYFAGLLHASLDPAGQRLLLIGALLPWMPGALLAELAGVPDATHHLERLCAGNLFTERTGQAPAVYRLHPLFHTFLRERGQRVLAAAEREALLRRAAQGFLALAQTDIAIDLRLDAGDLAGAADLWLAVLEAKLASGQLDQLDAWYARFGAAFVRQRPWLQYGRARIGFLREDPAARAHYEAAFAAFEALGDRAGRQLCAAGLLEWHYNTDSFIGHERWCAALGPPLADATHAEALAVRLLNGQLLACFFGGDFRADAAAWTARVLARLTLGEAENDKLCLAITLLGCLERDKRWDDAASLADRMQALLASQRLGPRIRILVLQQIAADLHRQTGNYGEARRLAQFARAQAAEHGFAVLEFESLAILLLAAQYLGDAPESERLLAELAARVDGANIYHQRFSRQMRAWHELQRGRLVAAREHADALRIAVERSEMPARFRATWLLIACFVDFAEGRHDAACTELARLADAAEAGSRDTLQANLLSLQAWRHWHAGELDAAAQALASAWALAARTRYYQLLAPLRTPLAELAAFALGRAIEPGFAHELIRRRELAPPQATTHDWPWPLRITTLGRFGLQVDGEALVFAGKVPKKPLALLKALIAFGGQAVPEHTLTDALWPDDEADAAHDAFTVALHRLRKLVPRGTQAFVLHDGALTLNPALCWTDARAFELLAAPAFGPAPADPAAFADTLGRALALYGGHFLVDDTDEAWTISTRERLRARFNQTLMRCGAALGEAGAHEAALACYRRGLEVDDLNEAFYQGVMSSCLALRRPAEGLSAYQRLRRMLALVLRVAPAAHSEALHEGLRELGIG
jgi:ATP/maltotriose-dependent transcriptional regulator MalT/DNA-binding SARP family transcriptional activator